jgi:hypothetical protein
MDRNKTIEILDALASGCSPITGETINESILNERIVIRALQAAIDLLRDKTVNIVSEIEISEKDIKAAIQLYKQQNQNPTSHKLTGLFLGTRKFKNNSLITNELYGKYREQYTEGQLLDFFSEYFAENKLTSKIKTDLYSEIDFFKKEKFNRLSENAIKQLKEKVNELGIEKTENLSEYVLNARTIHPRAYESWSDKEKTLLSKALEYTNDLDLLSTCFQRGKGSIEACGLKIIYESKK